MIYPTMSELVADKMIMDEGRPGHVQEEESIFNQRILSTINFPAYIMQCRTGKKIHCIIYLCKINNLRNIAWVPRSACQGGDATVPA